MGGMDFRIFGPWHLLILAAVPLAALLLSRVKNSRVVVARSAGFLLMTNELIWYVYRLRAEGFRFPEALPLQMCDLSLWLTVAAAITLKPGLFELAWYWGAAGASMALLTPDLWAPLCSYPTIYFFIAHGGLITILLFLTWTGLARPRPGSWWKALLVLNGYAALLGIFNQIFGTNYMFLCQKPESASLLDYMGPWPWYLASGEAMGAAMFFGLWLPFRTCAGPSMRLLRQ